MTVLTACGANPPSAIPFEDLPAQGDPTRGEALYTAQVGVMPACNSCHVEGARGAPTLLDYNAEVAAQRVDGEDAREYTFYAIAEPGRFIVEGYGNAMYNKYDDNLAPQDIADLIAYLHQES